MSRRFRPDELLDDDGFDEIVGAEYLDSELADEAEVTCPYCGETSAIGLDPGGGPIQEYIEDCQVCCQPWYLHVAYDETGAVSVWVTESG
jgi:hypothetical protein